MSRAAATASAASSAQRAARSPGSRALRELGEVLPATPCHVAMPPSAADANGPTCSQRRALPAHHLVDRLPGGDAALSTIHRASRRSACWAVPDEPGRVALHEHRALAAARDGRAGQLDGRRRAARTRDDLHERHQERRVPVVRADRALERAAGSAMSPIESDEVFDRDPWRQGKGCDRAAAPSPLSARSSGTDSTTQILGAISASSPVTVSRSAAACVAAASCRPRRSAVASASPARALVPSDGARGSARGGRRARTRPRSASPSARHRRRRLPSAAIIGRCAS